MEKEAGTDVGVGRTYREGLHCQGPTGDRAGQKERWL